jgi:putative membrane protein
MIVRLLLKLVALAVAIAIATSLVSGIDVSGGAATYLWVAFLLALVNIFIGPIVRLISLPLTILTLGLFALVINAALLGLTAWLSSDLSIDGFWAAFLAALIISICTAVFDLLIPDRR